MAANTFGFGYSARNRVVSVVRSSASVAMYLYSTLGRRIKKPATFPSGIAGRYDYDESSHLSSEYGSTNRDYVLMRDIPVAVLDVTINGGVSTSVINYVHADGLGTPRAVTNSAGSAVWTCTYKDSPFGEQQPVRVNGYVLNLRYAGQYYDAESGTTYNMARSYDPTVGRYMQSDPIGLSGGITTYGYVRLSPLMAIDARGLDDTQCMMNYSNCGWDWNAPNGGPSATAVTTTIGTALGAVAVNTLGFPEAEVAEAAYVGVEGAEALGLMDAIAGEPAAQYIVGGIMGGAPGYVVGTLWDNLTGPPSPRGALPQVPADESINSDTSMGSHWSPHRTDECPE